MRTPRVLAIGMATLALVGACSTGGGSAAPASTGSTGAASAPSGAKATIRIGSDNFYESKLMGEIYAQALEKAGYTVERKFGLGSRQERIPTMDAGQIDLVAEYVGSGLGFYDKAKIGADGQANADALQAAVKAKGLTVLAISPGQDTNAFVVRAEDSTGKNLKKISDLAAIQDTLKWGLPADCDTNPLCAGALKDYGINYPPKQRTALGACDVPMAQALQGKAIDVAELCSTQPAIVQFGFVVLEDDKKTQPAENIAPIVRDDYLAKVDAAAFKALLDAVSAKVTTEALTEMGKEVAVDQKEVGEVAKAFLTANGL